MNFMWLMWKQRVLLNGEVSDWSDVNAGVLQGVPIWSIVVFSQSDFFQKWWKPQKKEKVHFYLSNNILKFYQNPKNVTPLFWALNHYIWSQNIKNLNLVNSITLYTILLTLNKKYYYNFLWKSIFLELQGVKIYTYQRVKVFKKTSEISWKFGKYNIFHFFP